MVEELISQYVEELKAKASNYRQMESQIKDMDEELKSLNSRLGECYAQKQSQGLVLYKKRNFIQDFFVRHFSRQYKSDVKRIKLLEEEINELQEKTSKIYAKKKMSEIKLVGNIDGIEEDLEKCEDRDYAIRQIISKHPELQEDIKFISELLQNDLSFIQYDRTDSKEVYEEFIELAISELQSREEDPEQNAIRIEEANQIIDEIRNPKSVEQGKYKIPIKYLFEAIRKSVIGSQDLAVGVYDNKTIESAIMDAMQYIELDGKLPIQYGREIEEIYSNEDRYMLIHNIDNSKHMSKEEMLEIRDDIFEEGLRSSIQNEDCVNNLQRTTVGNYQSIGMLVSFLKPSNKVIMSIPRQAIDGKGEDKVPIWGADSEFASTKEPGYLLPEFVVGYVNKEEMKLERNLIPLEDRKSYQYKFTEQTKNAVEERTK